MQESEPPRVVALCGSLRDESRTRIVVREVLDATREAGGKTDLLDLRSFRLPGVKSSPDAPTDADRLRRKVDDAHAVLLATPNYHGSYSGTLKTALDYCGREEFEGTTVGLLEVAAGSRSGSALVHLRTVSRTLHAWTLPTEVAVPDSHSLIADDGIEDDQLHQRVRRLGRALAEYANVARYPDLDDTAAPTTGRGEVDD